MNRRAFLALPAALLAPALPGGLVGVDLAAPGTDRVAYSFVAFGVESVARAFDSIAKVCARTHDDIVSCRAFDHPLALGEPLDSDA